MPCPPLTNKGGKLYISEEPVDCDLTLSELAVLPYVLVPGVGSIGDTGIQQDIVTYPTTDAGLTSQGKGDATARNWDIEILDSPSAARDILDEASAVSNDDSYATRIEWPNGDVEFSIVQVASRTAVKGAGSGVRVIRYTMVPVIAPFTSNAIPEAFSVYTYGGFFVGSTLTGEYTYLSHIGAVEDGSALQWYYSDTPSGDSPAPIPGETSREIQITSDYDAGYLFFSVAPSDGSRQGVRVFSPPVGPIYSVPGFFADKSAQGGMYFSSPTYNGEVALYQDAAGTTPVTSPGDLVSLRVDFSGNGNDLIAGVGEELVYGRGPVTGRRNILNFNEQLDSTPYWQQLNGVDVPTNVGTFQGRPIWRVSEADGDGATSRIQVSPLSYDGDITVRLVARSDSSNMICVGFFADANVLMGFDTSLGEFVLAGGFGISKIPDIIHSVTQLDDGFWELVFSYVGFTSTVSLQMYAGRTNTDPGKYTDYNLINMEMGTIPTAYQKTGNQYDVEEPGVRTVDYIQYNGTSSQMATAGPVDFSGGDEVHLYNAVQITGSAAAGSLYGLVSLGLTGGTATNGTFRISRHGGGGNWRMYSRGGSSGETTDGPVSDNLINVLHGHGKISSGISRIYNNSLLISSSSASQGAINYASDQGVYTGSYNGGSFFPGRDYGLMVFGGSLTEDQHKWIDQMFASMAGQNFSPAINPAITAWNALIHYGQSLSVGSFGVPPLSTRQPYSNITFEGGPRSSKPGSTGDNPGTNTIIPLIENTVRADGSTNPAGETCCSESANGVGDYGRRDITIFASTAGKGGYSIAQLDFGSVWVQVFKDQMTEFFARAEDAAADARIQMFPWIQGESDATATVGYYKSKLMTLQRDSENYAKVYAGNDIGHVPYCLVQCERVGGMATGGVPKAQLHLAIENPERFRFATATYHMPRVQDGVHMTNIGYKWLGRHIARDVKRYLIDKKPSSFIRPISAILSGDTLTINCDTEYPLVVDEQTLSPIQDAGFRVVDSLGDVSISSVSASGNNVIIELAVSPSGPAVVRYAMDYKGALNIDGAAGNIRDSDPETFRIKGALYPMYRVMPIFELPIEAI